MQARLKAKLLNWKLKSISKTKRYKNMLARYNRSQQRIIELEAQLKELEQIARPQRITNHHYPAQLIALAVFMVTQAGSSLRCAAKTVGFVSRLLCWRFGCPSHGMVRNWVLRCGLYSYEQGEHKSGHYAGIIDESIQIGREKLLLLLGVKLQGDRSHCAPLTMADVEILGMEVQQSWTGDEVGDFITRRLDKYPDIRLSYVISDRGTALLAALRKLGLDQVSDCSHWLMNVVKKTFSANEELSKLSAQIGQLRRQLALTKDSFLLPPTLRDKDRFLRIFTIVQWSERIKGYWDRLNKTSRQKLDFLLHAETLIQNLRQVRALIVLTTDILKSAGLSPISQQRWEEQITLFGQQNTITEQGQALINAMRKYFNVHLPLFNQHQRLLCCSDIIESTFGRYKNKGGMKVISADVLAIALYKQSLHTDFITKALSSTSQQKIEQWRQRFICDNRYTIMKRMNQELKSVA